MIVGALAGAVAGLFLAPKPGKELRDEALERYKQIRARMADKDKDEIVQEIFDEVSERSREMYRDTKDTVAQKLAEISENIEKVDYEKYLTAVKTAIDNLRDKYGPTDAQIEKIKKHLEADFDKLNKDSKTASKDTKAAVKKKPASAKKS